MTRFPFILLCATALSMLNGCGDDSNGGTKADDDERDSATDNDTSTGSDPWSGGVADPWGDSDSATNSTGGGVDDPWGDSDSASDFNGTAVSVGDPCAANENGMPICSGDTLLVCMNEEWTLAEDCALKGGTCSLEDRNPGCTAAATDTDSSNGNSTDEDLLDYQTFYGSCDVPAMGRCIDYVGSHYGSFDSMVPDLHCQKYTDDYGPTTTFSLTERCNIPDVDLMGSCYERELPPLEGPPVDLVNNYYKEYLSDNYLTPWTLGWVMDNCPDTTAISEMEFIWINPPTIFDADGEYVDAEPDVHSDYDPCDITTTNSVCRDSVTVMKCRQGILGTHLICDDEGDTPACVESVVGGITTADCL